MQDASARESFSFPPAFVAFDPADIDTPIHARFQHLVRQQPNALAVRAGQLSLNYGQLNRAANDAARRLLACAANGPLPVALLVDQGPALIVWILAILKGGLAYAPLDTRLPPSVLARLLLDLGPRAIIADAGNRALAAALADGVWPVLDAESPPAGHEPTHGDDDLNLEVDPTALAYVFYTSGSTGGPKGVADSHRNVMHNIMRYTNSLGFAPGDRMSLVQNPSFSGTVSSLFGGLLNGAAVVLFDLHAPGAGPLGRWLRRERISVFHAVPSIYRLLAPCAERYPHLRLIRLEGDRATPFDLELFQRRFDPRCLLVNGLGMTECGLVRQFFVAGHSDAKADGTIPVGYPVADMSVHVVDDTGRPLPPGEVGEIVVDSRYLASGYWNNRTLTAQKFLALGDGLRRYRSGDLGKLDETGCLTHLGRVDQQPKIGSRFVDTGEIEAALLKLAGLRQAAVLLQQNEEGEHRLVAYLVADSSTVSPPSTTDIRRHLQGLLPQVSIPTAFVMLDALPLSPDGKLAYRRLPMPARSRSALPDPPVAVQSRTQATLADIWSEVLDIDNVGIDDDFFDLGGDSLLAARIVAHIVDQTLPGFAQVSIVDLFELPTIRELAAALDRRGDSGVSVTGDKP